MEREPSCLRDGHILGQFAGKCERLIKIFLGECAEVGEKFSHGFWIGIGKTRWPAKKKR
jgi:hypothetical protein